MRDSRLDEEGEISADKQGLTFLKQNVEKCNTLKYGVYFKREVKGGLE